MVQSVDVLVYWHSCLLTYFASSTITLSPFVRSQLERTSLDSIYDCLGFKRKEVCASRGHQLYYGSDCLWLQGGWKDSEVGHRKCWFDHALWSIMWQRATTVGSVGIHWNESWDGNQSILRPVYYICKMLGVNLDLINLVDILIGDWSKMNNVLKGDKAYSKDLDMSKSQIISFGNSGQHEFERQLR